MKDVKKSEEQENTKPDGDESADKQETKSATENEGWEKAEMFRRILLLLMDGILKISRSYIEWSDSCNACYSLQFSFQM